jgi:hypothetical protein
VRGEHVRAYFAYKPYQRIAGHDCGLTVLVRVLAMKNSGLSPLHAEFSL